jgi:predicted Fe-Mo cluster-binding NifX family protein
LFAVCADRDDSDAKLDESFGRCRLFAIYQGDGTLKCFVPNVALHEAGATDIKVVNCLTRQGVKSVVAAQYGQRALEVLNFAGLDPLVSERGLALNHVAALFMQGALKRW